LRRGENRSKGGKPLTAEKRTNKLNTRVASSLGIELRPHWWEMRALTTTPPLLYCKLLVVVVKTPESCVVVCFLGGRCCNSIEHTPMIFDYA